MSRMQLTWYGYLQSDGSTVIGYYVRETAQLWARQDKATAIIKLTSKSQVAMRKFFDLRDQRL